MHFSTTQKRAAAWIGIGLGIGLALWLLGPVLTPFVVAAVLAYALTPVVDRLDNLANGRMPRIVAVVLVEICFLIVLLSVLLLIVPIVAKELPLLREQIPRLFERLNVWLAPFLGQFGVKFSVEPAAIKTFISTYLSANFEDAFGSVLSSLKLGGSVALAIIGNAVLIPVALFYLLMDWKRFVERAVNFVPMRVRTSFLSFTSEADAVLGQYLRGQLLVMLSMAVFYSVGLALFGLDLALPIGVFTGLAMIVPYLGFGFGVGLGALAALLQFTALKALVMVVVVFGVGQLLESLVLTPRLVGERVGLHPLAVIFALLAFGQIFGFVGVLVALPASAVLLVAMRRVMATYLNSPLYKG